MLVSMLSFVLLLIALGAGDCNPHSARGSTVEYVPPTISYVSPEQIKDVGDTAELVCTVQDAKDYPVMWMKVEADHRLPFFTGSQPISRDSHFSVRVDDSNTTFTLQMKDVQEADAGLYQCQIIVALTSRITKDVNLLVRHPAPDQNNI